MQKNYRVIDEQALLTFECVFKHLCAIHGLGWEYITTITTEQLIEEEKNADDLLKKTLLVSSVTSDIEDILEEFLNQLILTSVATATEDRIRVDKADLRQFIWQYGHFVLAEEHYADYISGEVKKLQGNITPEQKKEIQEKILKLCNFLYTTRLTRKKYVSGFLERVERENKVAKEPTLPEAANHEPTS